MRQVITLSEDFKYWWNMPKYRKHIIEAQKFSDELIRTRHASNSGWPGPEKDVQYWVELENDYAVGFRHGKSISGNRRAKYAEFPLVKMK